MKFLLLLMISLPVFGKSTVVNFTQVLNEEVREEISKDDEQFKADAFRRPASVIEVTEPIPVETDQKIDKTVRQTGHPTW